MSRRSSWCWSRWIVPSDEALWTERLVSRLGCNWLIVEKPERKRLLMEACFIDRSGGALLQSEWGGRLRRLVPAQQKPDPPIRVSDKLTIVHDRGRRSGRCLFIPYGMAFGSGEHATTLMLLQALVQRDRWTETTFLDLGTGSGILALVARRLGATRIVATDFDNDAVRTARQNEQLNFGSPLIRWQVADVKRLRAVARYALVTANLFSGILIEAAPRIARALREGGELWLSGILRSQQGEVANAYCLAGLRLIKTQTRGRWVMQQWRR